MNQNQACTQGHAPAHRRRARRGAFTLIELLVVITILGILLALVGGLSGNYLGNVQLQNDAGEVLSRMAVAQQSAITENRPIQVRFYHWQDPESGQPRWGGVQLWHRDNHSGVYRARDNMHRFSSSLIAMPDPRHSSLLDLPERPASTDEGPRVEGATYVAFDFLPDGGTNLRVGSGDDLREHWFVTFAREVDVERAAGGVPETFVTVQIDPFTGAVRRLQL